MQEQPPKPSIALPCPKRRYRYETQQYFRSAEHQLRLQTHWVVLQRQNREHQAVLFAPQLAIHHEQLLTIAYP